MQILIILIALLVKKPLELDYSPIVVIKVGLKESFAYRRRRHVLPTPLFPIVSSLLEKKRASVGQKKGKTTEYQKKIGTGWTFSQQLLFVHTLLRTTHLICKSYPSLRAAAISRFN